MEAAHRSEWIRSLFDEYQGALVRYAARLTGNIDAARDAVQETFVQLCKMDSTKLDERPVPWLYTVCRNRALDGRRREARMSPLDAVCEAGVESRDASPLQEAVRRSATWAALKALAALPANQQEVIRLKFQEGLSYREIAQITGLSVGNVGFIIHTGIRGIRAAMNGGSGHVAR